jgi:nucleotide-binding universal stress UspA family protein
MFKHILIPTDGSKLSMNAVRAAITFAQEAGAEVTLLAVTAPFHMLASNSEEVEAARLEHETNADTHCQQFLNEGALKARQCGVLCETVHVEHDDICRAIIDTANDRSCDLIAMASHGRRGLSAVLVGSVTLQVLSHSRIPVLVYR